METRAGHIAVGAFVLLLAAGVLVFIVWLARFSGEADLAFYTIRFAGAVTGLQEGSVVRYRGIPVGRVSVIRIDPENPDLVQVTVEIGRGTPIRVDSVASLELQGITGVSFVQITGGTKGSKRLPETTDEPYPVIASRASRLEELFESAPALLTRLNQLVDRVSLLFSEENEKAISQTLDSLRTIMAGLSEDSGGLQQVLVNGAAAAEQVEAMSAEFTRLAADVRTQLNRSGGEIDKVLTEIRQTSHSFGDVSRQIDEIVTENRQSISDFTSFGLYETTQLITELRLLVASVQRVTTQIEREGPARFLFGDRRRGVEAR